MSGKLSTVLISLLLKLGLNNLTSIWLIKRDAHKYHNQKETRLGRHMQLDVGIWALVNAAASFTEWIITSWWIFIINWLLDSHIKNESRPTIVVLVSYSKIQVY